jgi:trehalose 6-phosphate synthase
MDLIVVSNRVSSLADHSNAAGGLAAALYQGMRKSGGTWFGWSGKTIPGKPGPATMVESGPARLATIDYNEGDFNGFYNGMANATLWPIMHNRVDLMVYDRVWQEQYERINRQIAEEVAKLVKDDSIIWVHDYHFLMVGWYLKQMGVSVPIGYFLHTPFPASFSIECIPNHEHLFGHLLAYDLIGFQTAGDMRSFLRYANRSLGINEIGSQTIRSMAGITHLDVFPVGIDVDAYVKLAEDAANDPQVKRLQQTFGEGSTIIGVDRLDYSKGLRHRFRGYERLLMNFPAWREKVTLLQIAPLTRSDIDAYQALQHDLATLTGRINGEFGNASWQPVRYTNESYPHPVLAGFYRNSDVCLITPLRDGMNLVCKEFVASQSEADPGVLVLSQFAGAAAELDAALVINPHDTEQIAEALDQALSMSLEERQERWRVMMKVLRVNDVSAWFDGFVHALEASTRKRHWYQRLKH